MAHELERLRQIRRVPLKTEASKKPNGADPEVRTRREKLAAAQSDYQKWSQLAASPELSTEAVRVAAQAARSSGAMMRLAEKSLEMKHESHPPRPLSLGAVQALDLKFRGFGAELSRFFISVIGIVMIFGVPLGGMAISIFAGAAVSALFKGGTWAAISGFAFGFFILIFLAVYVWEPRIWPAIKRATDALMDVN